MSACSNSFATIPHGQSARGCVPSALPAEAGETPALHCGSWKAPFRFCACIGTMNPDVGTQPLGCSGLEENRLGRLKAAFLELGSWRGVFLANAGPNPHPLI